MVSPTTPASGKVWIIRIIKVNGAGNPYNTGFTF